MVYLVSDLHTQTNAMCYLVGAVFLGFLFPPLNFSMGIFGIETYIYHHDDFLNYDHVDDSKNLASLSSVLACLFFSAVMYLFICWGMPFDWILPEKSVADLMGRPDETVYPCDDMDATDDVDSADAIARPLGEVLLDVEDVYHIYPDGEGISL